MRQIASRHLPYVQPLARSLLVIAASIAVVAVGIPAHAQPPSPVWLCHPDMSADPCDLASDTTDLATGQTTPATPVTEADQPVDCFYVYPTVSNQIALNADPVASPEVRSIARFQAARFSSVCRVFAPLYRQVSLLGLVPAMLEHNLFDTGYGDVLAAWDDYLAHDNNGRGVIFIGHSQGTAMLRKLLREQIDPNPQLRDRMVGAFMMGGNVTTARGSATGGDFAHIPVCTQQGEDGCVTAYSTELLGVPSLFGNSSVDLVSAATGLPHGPDYEVACTDPAVLAGDDRPVGITVPSEPFSFGIVSVLLGYSTFPQPMPTSSSTWTIGKGRGTGRCVDTNGFRRYRITMTVPEAINELPLLNTHLLDINYGYDRLIDIAHQQTHTWTEANR
ncbi:DUF3089 domain-containing protein [Nocardia sp. R16R-3T]